MTAEHSDAREIAVTDAWQESRQDVIQAIAERLEALAQNYPVDVFSPASDSRDAISGTAMRHAYRNAARVVREEFGAA